MSEPDDLETLKVDLERLRVEERQSGDVASPEAQERAKKIAAIEADIAKLEDQGDSGTSETAA